MYLREQDRQEQERAQAENNYLYFTEAQKESVITMRAISAIVGTQQRRSTPASC